MTDKILYSPKDGTTGFWWLREVPEEPEYCSGFDDRFCELCQKGTPLSCSFKKFQHYHQVESCKSNKVEIVNPEECAYKDKLDVNWRTLPEGQIIVPGDIFDLPQGFQFKEETFCAKCNHHFCDKLDHPDKKVIRLVKTETKETFGQKQRLKDKLKRMNEGKPNKKNGVLLSAEALEVSQPEPEESQEELWNQAVQDMFEHGNEFMLNNWTIQRKKQ